MATLLEQVPVDQETKAVLLGGASRLRPLYQLLLARESGDWAGSKRIRNPTQNYRDRSRRSLLGSHAVGAAGE
jgi:hypothetical protein